MTSTDARTNTGPTPAEPTERTVETFVERLFSAVLGAQEVQAAYLGDRLGWYRALAEGGASTPGELAARTGTAERYAREWLEHQAVIGWLAVDDTSAPPAERRYELQGPQAEVLVDADSLNYLLPLTRLAAGMGRQLDALVDAYRTGAGVPWSQHGADGREAQASANRPYFLHGLAEELSTVAEVEDVLERDARVADVGCGVGWSAIGLALAHPDLTVDGFDIDEPSIALAEQAARDAGVADRVHFTVADAAALAAPDAPGGYDLVFAFECVHDMADPVGALRTMRRLAGDDGTVIVMDERTAESFAAPGEPLERLLYGFSLTCCLPDGLSHPPAVGTGTVMRPATLEGYAQQAGFAGIDILPIDNDFFRFYRLRG